MDLTLLGSNTIGLNKFILSNASLLATNLDFNSICMEHCLDSTTLNSTKFAFQQTLDSTVNGAKLFHMGGCIGCFGVEREGDVGYLGLGKPSKNRSVSF